MQGQERERKEPSEFNVIVKAKDLVKHTFTITNSTERYPKKYRFTLVNRIQEKAVDLLQGASIFYRAFAGNGLYFYEKLRILVETCP